MSKGRRSVFNPNAKQREYWNPPIEFDDQGAGEDREKFVRALAAALLARHRMPPAEAILEAEALAAELEKRK